MRTPAGRALWVHVILLGVGAFGAEERVWTESSAGRDAPLFPGRGDRPRFTAMSPERTGIRFTNELRGDLYLTNAVAHNGSGVAVGDIDGDDRPDLYFCNLEGPNRLYRNLGNWQFEEVPMGEASCQGRLSTGAAFADVDGDGDLDLLVNGVAAGTRLFLNDGKGGWTEAVDSGLSRNASSTSMALADIDGDGDLDLYCTHYIDEMLLADPTTRFAVARRDGKWVVTKVNGESTNLPRWKDRFEALPDGRVREWPEVHGLYRNEGRGRFRAIQFETGVYRDADGKPVGPFRDWGLSAMFRDLDRDGDPDLYVCNDNASPDRIWINQGDGTFREAERSRFRHTSRSSMALDFADVDRDGFDDLLVLDMLARDPLRRMRQLMRDRPDLMAAERADEQPSYNRNTLFLGRPDGSFVETALMAGVAATDWSWCPVFLDVDLDGYEDLLVANGFAFDMMDQDAQDRLRPRRLTFDQQKRIRQFLPPWPTSNAVFRNRGDGTFEPVPGGWGFDRSGISYGMAVGDLDGDGDLDVVVNQLNEAAGIYRNDAAGGRVAVRLRGRAPNTRGIGARIRLVGGRVTQSQEMIAGGRYLSSDEPARVFAVDAETASSLRLEVDWRGGARTTLAVRPNRIYEVREPEGSRPDGSVPSAAVPAPVFRDVSDRLAHRPVGTAFDDWSVQPTLPRRLGLAGPGVGWFDLDGDGWEDLLVASGRGEPRAVYFNRQGSAFQRIETGSPTNGWQGAVVGWSDGRGGRAFLAGSSNPGATDGEAGAIDVLSWNGGNGAPRMDVSGRLSSGADLPGPLATADIDGDGDLDLFVGARFRPGRYPEPGSSVVWSNQDGRWMPNADASAAFRDVGRVNGAVFADLDDDGDPDLALAIDWGSIRVFRNRQGRFEEVTSALGLAGKTGWWTGIVAGDFDADGRLDLAAGNWGRNSWYELLGPGPLRLHAFRDRAAGPLDLVEAYRLGDEWHPARPRDWLERGRPDLAQRFPSYEAFARAPIREILGLGDPSATAVFVEVNDRESAVFLNRGTTFEHRPLPREAQWAPVFGLEVGDYDADGIEDLFLGQNFLGGGSDLSRDDGGRGQWLRGDGSGGFRAVETGIRMEGEQRGVALADFDHDGRVDLAVGQLGGPARLWRNQSPGRGIRVVVRGPASNPDGVGARLRLRYADGRMGPCREVRAGSGFGSQSGAVQVLGRSGTPSALWIRWPGGREESVPLEASTTDLEVVGK